MKINKSTEAIDHFQKSLGIVERLSDDPQNDKSVSITLHSIDKCLMETDTSTEAMNHFQKLLKLMKDYQMTRSATEVCQLLCLALANA